MTLKRIGGIVQFTQGNEEKWAGLNSVIRNNVLVYAIDTKIGKIGDGSSTYENLPLFIDMNKALDKYLSTSTPAMFDIPSLPGDIDKILIIGEEERVVYGELTATALANILSVISSSTLVQNSKIVTYNNLIIQLLSSLTINHEGKIVIVNGNSYYPSNYDIAEYIEESISHSVSALSLSIDGFKFYSDVLCTTEITELLDDAVYYAKIFASDSNNNAIAYTLASSDNLITILQINPSIFSISIGDHLSGNQDVTFNATALTDYSSKQLVIDSIVIDKESGLKEENVNIQFFFDQEMTNEATNNLIDGMTFYALVTAVDDNGFDISNYDLNYLNPLEIPGVSILAYGSLGNTFQIDIPEVSEQVNIIFEAYCETPYKEIRRNFNKNITDASTGLIINDILFYKDEDCTIPALSLGDERAYYAKVIAEDRNGFELIYPDLVSENNDVSIHITHLLGEESPIFEIEIDGLDADILDETFTATVSNRYAQKELTKDILVFNGVGGFTIDSLKFYSDPACTIEVTSFNEETTYYAKIIATDTHGLSITYRLTDNNLNTMIYDSNVNGVDGEFKIIVSDLSEDTESDFSAYADNTYIELSIDEIDFPIINASEKLTVSSIEFFTDQECTLENKVTRLFDTGTFYAKVNAVNTGDKPIVYESLSHSLTIGTIAISRLTNNLSPIFKLEIIDLTENKLATTFTAVVSNGYNPTKSVTAVLNIYDASGGFSLSAIKFYSDEACTTQVTELIDYSSFWAIIEAEDVNNLPITYNLNSSDMVNVTITPNGIVTNNPKFKIDLIDLIDNIEVIFTATANNGFGTDLTVTNTMNIIDVLGNIHITSLDFFMDAECTTPVLHFFDISSYYLKVTGLEDNSLPITYTGVTAVNEDNTPNADTTITRYGGANSNIFKIDIIDLSANKIIKFIAEITNGAEIVTKSIPITFLDALAGLTVDNNILFYKDAACTIPVILNGGIQSLFERFIFYAKVTASDANGIPITYDLNCDEAVGVIAITPADFGEANNPIFTVNVVGHPANVDVNFTATVSNGYGSKTTTVPKAIKVYDGNLTTVISNIKIYSNSGMTTEVAPVDGVIQLLDAKTYYAKIIGAFTIPLASLLNTGTLVSSSANLTITPHSNLIPTDFQIVIANMAAVEENVTLTGTLTTEYGFVTYLETDTLRIADQSSEFTVTALDLYTDQACTLPLNGSILYNGKTYYGKVTAADLSGNIISYVSNSTNQAAKLTITPNIDGDKYKFRIFVVGTITGDTTGVTITVTYNNTVKDMSYTKSALRLLNGSDVISAPIATFFTDSACVVPLVGFKMDAGSIYYAKINATELGGAALTFTLTETNANVTVVPHSANGQINEFKITLATTATGSIVFTSTATSPYGYKPSSISLSIISKNNLKITDIELYMYSDFSGGIITKPLDGSSWYAKVITSNENGTPIVYGAMIKKAGSISCNIYQDTIGDKNKYALELGMLSSGTTSLTIEVSCTDGFTTTPIVFSKVFTVYNYYARMFLLSGSSLDRFNSIAVDSEGNYVAVGRSGTSAIIVKLDNNLGLIGRRELSDPNGQFEFLDIAIDSSNNYYVCGSSYTSKYSCLIVKFTKDLTLSYKKMSSGSNSEQFNSITIDNSNNLIAVGFTYSEGVSLTKSNGIIVKFDTALSILNKKVFSSIDGAEIMGVSCDSNNNVFIAINRKRNVHGMDVQIIKLSSSLVFISGITYIIHSAISKDMYASKLLVDNSGNAIVVGYYDNASDIYQSAFIISTSNTTTFQSAILFTGSKYFWLKDIVKCSDGNYLVTGYSDSYGLGSTDIIILKIAKSTLNTLIKKIAGYSGYDYGFSVAQDKEGNYLFSGASRVITGSDDALIIKIPSDIISIPGTVKGTTIPLTLQEATFSSSDLNSVNGLTNTPLTLGMASDSYLNESTFVFKDSPGSINSDWPIFNLDSII